MTTTHTTIQTPETPTRRRAGVRLRRAALPLLAVAVLAACGDDADDALDTTTTSEVPAEATEVAIRLVDYAFEDVPATIAPGSRLTIVNESDAELHELVAFRVPDGDDRPLDELLVDVESLGQPALVLLQAPGSTEVIPAVGDGTLQEPGRYVLLCSIPTGADPAEYLAAAAASQGGPPQGVAGGPPHLAHGMVAEVQVEA